MKISDMIALSEEPDIFAKTYYPVDESYENV